MNRLTWVKVGVFVALVHALAYCGQGALKSPLQSGWDPIATAEASPLARFDAGWYRSIAEGGYFWNPFTGVGNVAFFPLFPFLMKVLAFSGLPLSWAGTLLSHTFFVISVVLFQRLEALRPGPAPAHSSLLALLTFPWAFFLLAPYSESLFLALALAAFLAALRGRWALVAFLGFLAGLTRIFGLALVPPLLILAWRANAQSFRARQGTRLPAVLAALTPAIGFGAFVAWLAFRFRDPLVFIHALQRGWGRRPSWSGLQSSLYAIAENIRQRGWLHAGPAVDLLVVLLLVASAAYALHSGRPISASYVGSGVALIAVSGSLLSSGRYALVLFPVFGFLALLARRPVVWYSYLLLSSTLQAYLVVRFVNNLWVA
jgi:Gpi18-like mannosyltransferase